jgi:hypothetical protein
MPNDQFPIATQGFRLAIGHSPLDIADEKTSGLRGSSLNTLNSLRLIL